MASFHGNVSMRPASPHDAPSRYVALLDVLGMKEWLAVASAKSIAEQLDEALIASVQGSCGVTSQGVSYGPLIGTTHFSDSLLAWSPDDSWASFATLCSAVKMIVVIAMSRGVPLRGSIALGEAVCSTRRLRFVGPPIAEAFIWAEKQRPYRSVGVDLTPSTLAAIRARLTVDPPPRCWGDPVTGTPRSVLERATELGGDLVWYRDLLFLNHWSHGVFTGGDPEQMFSARNLPVDDGVRAKVAEMQAFFQFSRALQTQMWMTQDFSSAHDPALWTEREAGYLALDRLRQTQASS